MKNTKVVKKKIKAKNIDEICEIFREPKLLTDKQVLSIINEYRGLDYIFNEFIDDIIDTFHQLSKKEQKDYIKTLVNLINNEIS